MRPPPISSLLYYSYLISSSLLFSHLSFISSPLHYSYIISTPSLLSLLLFLPLIIFLHFFITSFPCPQIVDETMLEDLNNVLNTGELSNLFASDETDKIVSDMIPVCKAVNMPETRENCLSYFVSRVRDKLHIVLCMSPVGDSLRIRCRQFPSLINCTNIDWFHGWPEAALVSVAGQ